MRNEEVAYIGPWGEVFEYEPTPGKILYRVVFTDHPNIGPGRIVLGIEDFATAVAIVDDDLDVVSPEEYRGYLKRSGVQVSSWMKEDKGEPRYDCQRDIVVIPTSSSPSDIPGSGVVGGFEVPDEARGYVTAHEIAHLRGVKEGVSPYRGGRIPFRGEAVREEFEADRRALEWLGKSDLGREELEKSRDFRIGLLSSHEEKWK